MMHLVQLDNVLALENNGLVFEDTAEVDSETYTRGGVLVKKQFLRSEALRLKFLLFLESQKWQGTVFNMTYFPFLRSLSF